MGISLLKLKQIYSFKYRKKSKSKSQLLRRISATEAQRHRELSRDSIAQNIVCFF